MIIIIMGISCGRGEGLKTHICHQSAFPTLPLREDGISNALTHRSISLKFLRSSYHLAVMPSCHSVCFFVTSVACVGFVLIFFWAFLHDGPRIFPSTGSMLMASTGLGF